MLLGSASAVPRTVNVEIVGCGPAVARITSAESMVATSAPGTPDAGHFPRADAHGVRIAVSGSRDQAVI
jgi:hypothetical protein